MNDWVYRNFRIFYFRKTKKKIRIHITVFHYFFPILFFPFFSFFTFLDVNLHCYISFFFHSFLSLPLIFAFWDIDLREVRWIHDGLKIRIDRMLSFVGKFRRKDWIPLPLVFLRLGGGCFVSFHFRLKYTVGSPRDTNAIVNRDGEKGVLVGSLIYERNRKSSTNVLPFVPLFVPSQRWVRLKGVHCDLAAPREKLDRIFQSDRFNFCSSSVL